ARTCLTHFARRPGGASLRVVTFDRPEHFSSPDGDQEHLFIPLEDEDLKLAHKLLRRYAERWLIEAELPADRLDEAINAAELKTAPDDEPGLRRLRLTSFYTGTTYWRYGWDGSEAAALSFMDETAELQGGNVRDDRRHGPTPWDESPNRARKRARRPRKRAR